MPEGPSIVILKEELKSFEGKKIISAKGYSKIDMKKISGQKILSFESWGKHFLICFKGFYLRIHLLMFGSYRVNERKDANPALSLSFKGGEVNFYTCSVKLFEEDVDETYDWSADVMSDSWNPVKAIKNLKDLKKVNVCDALLNQEIFSGVGNIIKNEVLFRTRIHPKNLIENIPAIKLKELVREASNYSWDFYEWKKTFELKKHWLIYKKKECPRCKIPAKKEYIGKGKRLTCFCDNCQIIYK
jgi:endonuclease-8